MYSIVIPFNPQSGNDQTLLYSLGLSSYSQYAHDLYKIYIITNDTEDVSQTLPRFENLCISIVDESKFLVAELVTKGWYKQQLLKLLLHDIVETPYYLIADSDMYLTQPLYYRDLVDETGRLTMHTEPWQEINDCNYSINSTWVRQSCAFMNYPLEQLCLEPLMSVTPQLFVREVVAQLVTELRTTEKWQQRLCDRGFTECCLYWIFLRQHGYHTLYTDKNDMALWRHDRTRNILDYDLTHGCEHIQQSFTHPKTLFGVIQGYLRINVSPYIEVAHKMIHRTQVDAIVLTTSMAIPNRRQHFSIEERFVQTLETATSVKTYFPNTYRILVEGTPKSLLNDDHVSRLEQSYDIVLYPGDELGIKDAVNHPWNIGFGECALLLYGLDYIQSIQCPVQSQTIMKLGARYTLNEHFQHNSFCVYNKFVFREHLDESLQQPVYTTGLYGVPTRYLHLFRRMLESTPHALHTMVERMYHERIPRKHVSLVPELGLSGRLSYDGRSFSV